MQIFHWFLFYNNTGTESDMPALKHAKKNGQSLSTDLKQKRYSVQR